MDKENKALIMRKQVMPDERKKAPLSELSINEPK